MSLREVKQGWIYPCDVDMFSWKTAGYLDFTLDYYMPFKMRKSMYRRCDCGKDCKPIKVKITVEEI